MPDLFALLPPLKRTGQPLLTGREVTLLGVSAILRDDDFYYFEVNRPRYWSQRGDGPVVVGIGGIGGGIKPDEGALECLRREVREELGVEFKLEVPQRTALLNEWEFQDWLSISPSRKHPTPYLISLFPPRLGGPGQPDSVAIVTFLGRPRGRLERRDIFGLLRIRHDTVRDYLMRDEWPLEEALAHEGLGFELEGELPAGCVLRPVLTAKTYQALIQAGVLPDAI
jgi:8-oxo-dGTP pyrophosphatase MutT (NUDIX family)